MISQDNFEYFVDTTKLMYKLFEFAKAGFSISFSSLLDQVHDPDNSFKRKVLNYHFKDGVEVLTIPTIASKKGKHLFLKDILRKYRDFINLEEENLLENNDVLLNKATALSAAVCGASLTCVKLLIKAGAKVDHLTSKGTSSLKLACYNGNYIIFSTLIAHGADVNLVNPRTQFSNLMYAAVKGYTDFCKLLLTNNADVNAADVNGNTALHYAAKNDHLNVVKLLTSFGAIMSSNHDGIMPYILAADNLSEEIVDFFVRKNVLTKQQRIDLYELLGATYITHPNSAKRNIIFALTNLTLAMFLRFSNENDLSVDGVQLQPQPIIKETLPPIEAYNNWIECKSLDELDSISEDENLLFLEGLTIRERILGRNYFNLSLTIFCRGQDYFNEQNYDEAEKLWLHALLVKQNVKQCCKTDLADFVNLYEQKIMFGGGYGSICFNKVLQIFECCVIQLRENKDDIREIGNTVVEGRRFIQREIETNMKTSMCILIILMRIIKLFRQNVQPNDFIKFRKIVHQLVALDLRFLNRKTLLHIACGRSLFLPANEYVVHPISLCNLPCDGIVNILLECGANVDKVDNNGNTPLHTLAKSVSLQFHTDPDVQKNIMLETAENIIKSLVNYDLHLDKLNCNGKTAAETAYDDSVIQLIRRYENKLMTLKCLSAKCIASKNIQYKGIVPNCLDSFISVHEKAVFTDFNTVLFTNNNNNRSRPRNFFWNGDSIL